MQPKLNLELLFGSRGIPFHWYLIIIGRQSLECIFVVVVLSHFQLEGESLPKLPGQTSVARNNQVDLQNISHCPLAAQKLLGWDFFTVADNVMCWLWPTRHSVQESIWWAIFELVYSHWNNFFHVQRLYCYIKVMGSGGKFPHSGIGRKQR